MPPRFSLVLAAYYAAIALLAPQYFRTWRHPQLVNLLADMPPGTSVAGTDMDDLDFIPLLARRPVLFSREHAVAYQLGYYRQIEARMRDIADVELSSDPSVVADRLQRNHIALYLTAAEETGDRVISPTVGSFVGEAYVAALRQQVDGGRSVLSRLAPGCTKERVGPYRLLDASCLIAEARRSQ